MVNIELTHEELIEKEVRRKKLRAEAQKRYRENIKNNTSKTSAKSLEIFRDDKAEYMRKYRAARSKKLIEARAAIPEAEITPQKLEKEIQKIDKKVNLSEARRSSRKTEQVDLSIKKAEPIVKPKIQKRIVPMWRKKLPANASANEIREAKSYPQSVRKVMIKKIEIVITKVLKKDFTAQHKQLAHKILLGDELKGDLKTFKTLYPFLSDNNLIGFVNKVQDYYPKVTSFATMIVPFVNLLARLDDVYDKEYQQLSLIAKNASIEYNEERDQNAVNQDDRGKIFSFDPDDVKEHIDQFLTTPKDKALAAVYGLQPPRRLDFQYMKLTEYQDVNVLTDTNFNYLEEVSQAAKHIILSTGMSTQYEVHAAVKFFMILKITNPFGLHFLH